MKVWNVKEGEMEINIYSLSTVNPNITSFVPDGGCYVVNVTDTVTFQCIATGVPPPIIQWYRGGQLLDSSMDIRISLSKASIREPSRQLAIVERTLNISDTTKNDTDSAYSCRATNDAEGRMDSETFSLFVQGIASELILYISCHIRHIAVTTT